MLTHAEGEGQAAFTRWKHSTEVTSERDDGVTCKQSLFVEPVSWMQSDVQQLQGKVENQHHYISLETSYDLLSLRLA